MEIKSTEMRARRERRSPAVRFATIEQLTEQLFVVQKMGQWLANETHGDSYDRVRALNEFLHLAHSHLRGIEACFYESHGRSASGAAFKRRSAIASG